MRHSMPISATFNIFQYINVTPNIQLNDRMYTRKVIRAWDPAASAEVMDTTYGFYNIFDFNASIAFDTKIYGFFQPMKFLGDKVQMIRHVMSPSISFSGSPDFSKDFWGYYGKYDYVDRHGRALQRKYSYFGSNIFGSVGEGKSGMVSFSLSNNVEMKVKSDQDSTGTKKYPSSRISPYPNPTTSQPTPSVGATSTRRCRCGLPRISTSTFRPHGTPTPISSMSRARLSESTFLGGKPEKDG